MKRIQYGSDNYLQRYEVYVPESLTVSNDNMQDDGKDDVAAKEGKEEKKIWIIYIHGGYFRDPLVDATSFRHALELLTGSTLVSNSTTGPALDFDLDVGVGDVSSKIAGYASIDYRLSAHPSHSQDPQTTPAFELRAATWPDHLHDVYTALAHLQHTYKFGTNYILAGHSVGATLAFLVSLGLHRPPLSLSMDSKSVVVPLSNQNIQEQQDREVHNDDSGNNSIDNTFHQPKCLIGLNGIYNFPLIHTTNPGYEPITHNAISDPRQYVEASPALYTPDKYTAIHAQGVDLVMISHSRDDGLVEWSQVDDVVRALHASQSMSSSSSCPPPSTTTTSSTTTTTEPVRKSPRVEILETKGEHNQIWLSGHELARTIRRAVELIPI